MYNTNILYDIQENSNLGYQNSNYKLFKLIQMSSFMLFILNIE